MKGLEPGDSTTFQAERQTLKYDSGEIQYTPNWQDPGTGLLKAEGWAEYKFSVPTTSWYGLYFQAMPPFSREIYMDGKRVSLEFGLSTKTAVELLGLPAEKLAKEDWTKEANVPLKAGEHTLRVERLGRMGFPAGLPRAWKIVAADSNPSSRIAARMEGFDALRVGESVKLSLTGGGNGIPADYEIVSVNGFTNERKTVANVQFKAGQDFETRTVEIPCVEEGVFHLLAMAGGRPLTNAEFRAGSYSVVDTGSAKTVSKDDAPKTLVHEIDCIANTLDGKPIVLGQNFWEANGPTRIVDSKMGKYRESSDGRGSFVNPHPKFDAENFPGFSYLMDVPEPGKAYLVEIDHPDDDWRSVCVALGDIVDWEKQLGTTPRSFAYETGGYLPLSNTMLTERLMFWPNGKQLHIGLVSSRIGKRSAASRIRVYEINGPLPSLSKRSDGRFAGLWMEEPERWHEHFNTPKGLPPFERDFVGLKRTTEWISYTGMNGFWPSVVAYQNATFDSEVLKGYLLRSHDNSRLAALFCEKYKLAYVAEIFLAKQRYFNKKVMTAGAKTPDDLYDTTWWGFSAAHTDPGSNWPSWNILHPQVQEKMIEIYGEESDKLIDSPSFAGMSGRIDAWQWDGLYGITSLNWGYGDWTVSQFEKDTGIKVPTTAASDDVKRFEERYHFLTSTEMKPKWIAWRCGRVTDFLRRLSERISHGHKDVALYLCGDGRVDENHGQSLPRDMTQRLREMGLDTTLLAREKGIAILPTGYFGRGKTVTYLGDQAWYDAFLDPTYVAAGFNAVRGMAYYGAYQEWGASFPYHGIGYAPVTKQRPEWNYYCTGSDAAGVNALERLSDVLADQDTMVIRDGGYPLIFGRRDYYSEWMAEFSQLPRRPFQPVAVARDPVAVWQRDDSEGFLFYAVNREQYPVTISLTLSGPGSVTRLGTGESVKMEKGELELALAPYELRAFKALQGTHITAAKTTVPPERIAFVQQRLAFAKNLAPEVETGAFSSAFTEQEKTDFKTSLQQAREAMDAGHYWRARTVLSMAPMMDIYQKFGEYPPGQLNARFPNLLSNAVADKVLPNEPYLDADALNHLVKSGANAELVESESYNPEWQFTKVVKSTSGSVDLQLDVPASAKYQLVIGYVLSVPGALSLSVDDKSVAPPLVRKDKTGEPLTRVYPPLFFANGKAQVHLDGPAGFGIYAIKVIPQLRALDTTLWSTIAPFKSFWSSADDPVQCDLHVKQGMMHVYGPEQKIDLVLGSKDDVGNRDLHWQQGTHEIGLHEDAGPDFAMRNRTLGADFGYAVTFITSPDERDAMVYIGTDWWANAWLNGDMLKPDYDPKEVEATGAWFIRHKPRAVAVHLKKGLNTLLVKNQGGNAGCWFICYVTDPGDLKFSATDR